MASLADLVEDEKHGPVTPLLVDVCDSYITLQVRHGTLLLVDVVNSLASATSRYSCVESIVYELF